MAPVLTRQNYDFMKPPGSVATTAAPSPAPIASAAPAATNTTVKTRTAPVLYGGIENGKPFNPYTRGFETTTPTVGVNEGQYAPDAKQSLWQNSGQTGAFQTEAFYRGADGSLQIKPEYVRKMDTSTITSPNDATSFLQGYENDRLGGIDYGAIASTIKGTAPANYNRVADYQAQREAAGIGTLEGQAVDLDKQIADLQAATTARKQAEEWKAVPLGVIAGRVGEVERQEAERLGTLQRNRQYISDQIKVKTDTIDTMMKLQGQDYDSALKEYDSNFDKNMKLIELTRGLSKDQMSQSEKLQDNARASLTTLYNSVTSGGLDPAKLSESQKSDIRKLEVQAGMPPGIIQTLYDKNPKSDIVFTTKATETDGNDYLQMVTKDRDTGVMKTEKFLLGKSADYQLKTQAAALAAQKATKKTGSGTSAATKATAAATKDAQKLKTDFNNDSATYSTKVLQGDLSESEAHNYLYKKYGESIKAQGYDDAQTKNIIYNKLK